MKWLSIEKEIIYATNITTHAVINNNIMEELSALMPTNNNNLRLGAHKNLLLNHGY